MSKHDTGCLCTDCRLSALEKQVFMQDRKPQPAQPRTPRLVEACEKLISRCQIIADDEQCDCEPEGHICGLPDFRREINNVRLALAAEKKRQELVDAVLKNWRDGCDWKLEAALKALDAFEKEAQ